MLRQRMYHLVLYSLSPIQKGIQAYHAGVEYMLKYGDTEEYKQWSEIDKTVIILDGGTSNKEGRSAYDNIAVSSNFGTMEKHHQTLHENKIPFACFFEPDLNNSTTAIAFLVDEKVWDKEKYPDPLIPTDYDKDYALSQLTSWYGGETAFLRIFLKQFKLA